MKRVNVLLTLALLTALAVALTSTRGQPPHVEEIGRFQATATVCGPRQQVCLVVIDTTTGNVVSRNFDTRRTQVAVVGGK